MRKKTKRTHIYPGMLFHLVLSDLLTLIKQRHKRRLVQFSGNILEKYHKLNGKIINISCQERTLTTIKFGFWRFFSLNSSLLAKVSEQNEKGRESRLLSLLGSFLNFIEIVLGASASFFPVALQLIKWKWWILSNS
jgi:hypothetical protein